MGLIHRFMQRRGVAIVCCLFWVALGSSHVLADGVSQNSADRFEKTSLSVTALGIATASFFAYLTTIPGLMLYYAGMVRRKNVLSVMMQCMALMFLMSLVWVLWGYALAFGEGRVLSSLSGPTGSITLGLDEPDDVRLARCFYHGSRFVLATCLLCGAVVERMRLRPMLLFGVLWGTFVFCPICHWTTQLQGVTGVGPFARTLDFAGAQPVHIAPGVSALICALVVGRRLGFGMDDMRPHNLTFTTTGAALIWLGALGMHFGSALAGGAPNSAISAIVFTHLSISAAATVWAGLEWIQRRKASILGIASGAVAGFAGAAAGVGITGTMLGVIVGAIAGAAALSASGPIKRYFRYDDSLDVFGVHAVAGATGLILTAIFAGSDSFGIPGSGPESVGMFDRLTGAVLGLALTAAYSAIVSLLILKLLDLLLGLRVLQEAEMRGLDLSEHGQEGYIFN